MPHAHTVPGMEPMLCALQDGSLSSLGVHPSGTKQRGWSRLILGSWLFTSILGVRQFWEAAAPSRSAEGGGELGGGGRCVSPV